ncbi:MAG: radical SAM protein, partial [Planctomycetota bacterium]
MQRHRAKLFEWAPGIDALIGVFDRDKITEAVRGPGGASTREANTLDDAGHTAPYWISGNALVKAKADPAIAGGVVAGITVNGKDGQGLGYFESDASRLRLTPRHYAYLRISEGCNQKCAFCTIPSIRGKMRSKGEAAVLDEARELLRDGAHELLLIGQDTTSYGDDIGRGLADGDPGDRFSAGLPRLLSELERVVREETGRGWLRLMYAYPTTFTDPVID